MQQLRLSDSILKRTELRTMADAVRTRLERGEKPGVTEVYVSHRGMAQINISKDRYTETTKWQVRPVDPELEAEMLSRLAIRVGARDEQIKAEFKAPEQPRATISKNGELPEALLLVRVPALKVLWGAHDEAVHSRHRYTKGELRALLEAAGLEVLRLSYCNSILFPLLLVRRTLDRLASRHGSDVEFLPSPLEWMFRHFLLVEAALIRYGLSLPVGASVVALARKR